MVEIIDDRDGIDAFLPEIKNLYSQKLLHAVRRLGGLQARNWLVEGLGVKYVLKQYASEASGRIVDIDAFTKAWHGEGIKVALPLKSGSGEDSVLVQGRRFALIPFSHGQVKHETTITHKELWSAGQTLARMHKVKQPAEASKNADCNAANKLNSSSSHDLDIITPGRAYRNNIARASIDLKNKLIDKLSADLVIVQPCACHGDFHNENVLFDNHGSVDCVIDFEYSHWGDPANDIAKFLDLTCCTSGYGVANRQKAATFLSGYRSLVQLPQAEIRRGLVQRFRSKCLDRYFEDKSDQDTEFDASPYLIRDMAKIAELNLDLDGVLDALSCSPERYGPSNPP